MYFDRTGLRATEGELPRIIDAYADQVRENLGTPDIAAFGDEALGAAAVPRAAARR
ncbi:hypothetical protein ACFXKD_12560 [Nocardiopsis aegyptia]|uniref:hypothetical protein n=1 Tax=Nocardiopsis aegyptia TaxID=220378 RepID=UPI00366C9FAB